MGKNRVNTKTWIWRKIGEKNRQKIEKNEEKNRQKNNKFEKIGKNEEKRKKKSRWQNLIEKIKKNETKQKSNKISKNPMFSSAEPTAKVLSKNKFFTLEISS